MQSKRTFISFDYDHDSDLKNLLAGQARLSDSPFSITDMSIKETIASNWKDNARTRIKGCDAVIVICGTNTNTANGVSAEIKIAQEERIPYFLLYGRASQNCVKPIAAKSTDLMYNWTWVNLKALIGGER